MPNLLARQIILVSKQAKMPSQYLGSHLIMWFLLRYDKQRSLKQLSAAAMALQGQRWASRGVAGFFQRNAKRVAASCGALH